VNLSEIQTLAFSHAVVLLVLLVPAALVWWLLRRAVLSRLDPRPRSTLQPFGGHLLSGIGWAAAVLALSILPSWIGGGYASSDPAFEAFRYTIPSVTTSVGGWVWTLFALQSLNEELIFRLIGFGLLGTLFFWLTRLVLRPAAHIADPQSSGARKWLSKAWFVSGLLANAVVAAGFAWVHHANPNTSALALGNITLAGLVLGQLFWLQASPAGAWMLHFIWNAGLATLGLPVSGVAFTPPLIYLGFTGAHPGWLSGGAFGPEGSLPNTVALLLVFAMLVRITWKEAGQRSTEPTAPTRPVGTRVARARTTSAPPPA
jgi:hypothetical protein